MYFPGCLVSIPFSRKKENDRISEELTLLAISLIFGKFRLWKSYWKKSLAHLSFTSQQFKCIIYKLWFATSFIIFGRIDIPVPFCSWYGRPSIEYFHIYWSNYKYSKLNSSLFLISFSFFFSFNFWLLLISFCTGVSVVFPNTGWGLMVDLQKRIEGLTEAELEGLLEQVEEEKRRLASGEQVN